MNPELVEATLNKAQSLLDGLRSTWLRRDLVEMADEARLMRQAMHELIEALRR
jgi:hypothetical protein